MKRHTVLVFLGLALALSPLSRAEIQVEYQRAFAPLQFTQPVLMTYANDSPDRLYVVEQGGRIYSFSKANPERGASLWLDLNKIAGNDFQSGGEQGLLGLAFDPAFAENGFFYLNYSAKSPRRTVIARFRVSTEQPSTVYIGSERVLLDIDQDFANHNGGMLAFGPDGYLYIGMGDGGSAGDPRQRAQDGGSLLGKMLRIDGDGRPAADNPFVSRPGYRAEIWALGLRNPWRFSFDRQTGALWAGDVGQNQWEEVNLIRRAGNYGWNLFEGRQPYRPDTAAESITTEAPLHDYGHDQGQSITGGYVYRGARFPALQGWYFFGDFVSGRMWALNSSDPQQTVQLADMANPAAFAEDAQGELYVLSYQGNIYQLMGP